MQPIDLLRPDVARRARAAAMLLWGTATLGCGQGTSPSAVAQLGAPLAGPPAAPAPKPEDKPRSEPEPSTAQADWPAWRGPQGGNVAPESALPGDWPQGLTQPRWEVALGAGWSSPVVSQSHVVISDRQGDSERVLAFDQATGRRLWEATHPVSFEPHPVGRNHGAGPKATPLIVGQRVYALGIGGWLECLELTTGRRVWSVQFPAEFGQAEPLPAGRARVVGTEHVLVPIGAGQGAPVPLFGYTGSPVRSGSTLVTAVGGVRGGTLMAFDLDTGRVRWKALEEEVSYSSPIVAQVAGQTQVVAMTGPRVVGLDPTDGHLLWSFPFQIQYNESISTPATAGDLVLVTGDGHPLTALRIAREGAGWRCDRAWENPDLSSYLSSLVVVEDCVYGMADDGRLACVALADGQTRWQAGDHGYYASPLAVGRRLLALNEQGQILLFAADRRRLVELGRLSAATKACWTVPAVSQGDVLVRCDGQLRCWGAR